MHNISAVRASALARRLSGIGTVALCVCGPTAVAQISPRASTILRLDGATLATPHVDSAVTRLMDAAHVTGVGIAIFHDGAVRYLHAYGHRDVEKALALTPSSVMTSASLSKAAFATVVMNLVQHRVLDLDRPISEYLPKPLPSYPAYADLRGDDRYRTLTLRMLLSHTSGFANWRAFEEDRRLKVHFTPGSRYAYSGEGIDLAQFVVETVTGKTATVLMRETLFEPLGMTRTSMIWQSRFETDFANGYDEYGRSLGPEKRSRPDAAGSMQTTLADYATFLASVLQHRTVDERTATEMLRPQIAIHSAHQFPSLARDSTHANDGIALSYGLGWGVYSTPLGRAFFKEGHDEGWRHLALLFDSTRAGILIMTNSSNGEGIFKPLLDSLLGPTSFPFEWEGYTPYTELPPPPKLKQHARVSLSPAELKDFAGRYALSPQVVLTVTVEGSRIFVKEGDEPKQELLAQSQRGFFSATSDDEYTFSPASGQAQVMVLHIDGKDLRLSRIK